MAARTTVYGAPYFRKSPTVLETPVVPATHSNEYHETLTKTRLLVGIAGAVRNDYLACRANKDLASGLFSVRKELRCRFWGHLYVMREMGNDLEVLVGPEASDSEFSEFCGYLLAR